MKIRKDRVQRNSKRLTEARITIDLADYKPWSGAVWAWNKIMEENKLEELDYFLDELYCNQGGVLSETELNDLLWFDWEMVFESLGIDNPYKEEGDDDDMDEKLQRRNGNKKISEHLLHYDYQGNFIGITNDEFEDCPYGIGRYNDYPYGTNDCISISKNGMNNIARFLGINHIGIGDTIDFYFEDMDVNQDETVYIENFEIVDRKGDSYILQATGDDNMATSPYAINENLKRQSSTKKYRRVTESLRKAHNARRATRMNESRRQSRVHTTRRKRVNEALRSHRTHMASTRRNIRRK